MLKSAERGPQGRMMARVRARAGMWPVWPVLGAAMLSVAMAGAALANVDLDARGSGRANYGPASVGVEIAARRGTEYGSGGKPPPRGSSAEINGGSSADRYGGNSSDKGGVGGRRDARVAAPKKKTDKNKADKAKGGGDKGQNQDDDQDREQDQQE